MLDRYLLRLVAWPLAACLGATLTALLLERILRLLDMLSQSADRFGYVMALSGNLVPHYLGLALPLAFFLALFMVVTRLNDDSEVDALLAGGVSLSRLAAPFVLLGVVLSAFSLIVFGYMQPYSRYGYSAVLHTAQNAGWNGVLPSGEFIDQGRLILTADSADPAGETLRHVFVRRLDKDGREEVVTAQTGRLAPTPDRREVTVQLTDGQRVSQDRRGAYQVLNFNTWTLTTPLAGAAKLLRERGGDERELTLNELWAKAHDPNSILARPTVLAELYGRLARALCLPFMPLMAFPLGLAAKRARRAPGLILAGVVLVGFQHGLQLGAGMAQSGHTSAELGVLGPFVLFCLFCVWVFVGSRKRPGETPISKLADDMQAAIAFLSRPWRRAA